MTIDSNNGNMSTPINKINNTKKPNSSDSRNNTNINNNIVPGQTRIRDSDGFVGTILYVGPVASTSKKHRNDVYVGVEWDDATRGKHDGSVICKSTNSIVRHFTSTTPTGGSFLKGSKLDETWNLGVPLSDELMELRYVGMDAELVAPNNVLPYCARTAGGREKPIEFFGEVGVRERQQLDDLEEIALRSMGVNGLPKENDQNILENVQNIENIDVCNTDNSTTNTTTRISERFSQVKELDLAGNLLSNWKDVLDIITAFPQLQVVSFASNRIENIHTHHYDQSKFHNLRILNVNKCSITSFATILKIDQLCPNLEELCVAYADLSDIDRVTRKSDATISTNGECKGKEQQKQQQEKPDTLSLQSTLSSLTFSRLTLLDCTACNLSNWTGQINIFSSLPKLETLLLNDNPIDRVDITPVLLPTSPSSTSTTNSTQTATSEPYSTLSSTLEFTSLVQLQLANTTISSSWSHIESIAHLPKLKSLRLRNTPLTSAIGSGEARSNIIARVPQIRALNASSISEKERVEAERRYVMCASRELLVLRTELQLKRQQQQEEQQSEQNSNDTVLDGSHMVGTDYGNDHHDNTTDIEDASIREFYTKYPRFQELMKIHKDTMILSSIMNDSNSGSISSTVVSVTIRSMAVESCTCAPLKKRLPGNLKVGRLKLMCSRAFGLNVELQRLHFRIEGDPFPTELDDDENTLSYYGVNEGADILMNEIDVEAEQREDKRRAELNDKLIEEQEQSSAVMQAAQKNDIKARATAVVEKASAH